MGRTRRNLSGPGAMDPFAACLNIDFLKRGLITNGLATEDTSDEEAVRVYHESGMSTSVSPNACFDEQWYRQSYADIDALIESRQYASGFMHFIHEGIFEGRWPNAAMKMMVQKFVAPPLASADFPSESYLAENSAAESFLTYFPLISAAEHYNNYGRFMGAVLQSEITAAIAHPAAHFHAIEQAFDADFYRASYMSGLSAGKFYEDPLSHYLVYGIPAGHSPNVLFDEEFYRAFYPEVREAVRNGEICNGFYHYIVAGYAEHRVALFDRKQVLETRVPGVTRPILRDRTEEIRVRLQRRKITVAASAAPRIWVLLPTINPDITFGGYRSVFELIRRLHESGRRVTIVCTEDGAADKGYFLWREGVTPIGNLIRKIDVIGYRQGREIKIGAADTVLVYSLWDLYAAEQIRDVAPATRVVLLAQEFEPIFYDNGAPRAIVEEAYRIPHYPLINSGFLRRYFEAHRIGVFDRSGPIEEGRDFAVFEHRINKLPLQTADEMRERSERLLVAYARPESHAARNMFEVLLLALQRLCEEGAFGPEWTFIGLGALTDIDDIPLGNGHHLVIHPKMSEELYTQYIKAMDIGVSLMFAPHPSVVPFEFATTGALVVTNVYENRSEAELTAISPNIIAARPSIEGVADALRRAIALVPDVDRRLANIYIPEISSWSAIFNDTILDLAFGLVEQNQSGSEMDPALSGARVAA